MKREKIKANLPHQMHHRVANDDEPKKKTIIKDFYGYKWISLMYH